jgi:two-component system, cell cycle response regulator
MKSKHRMLLIENNREYFQKIQDALCDWEKASITLEVAETLSDGFDRTQRGDIDLVLLDLSVSDSEGFDAIGKLKSRPVTLPVLALIGSNDEDAGLTAVNQGAEDYLCKDNINKDSLRRSVRYTLERGRMAEELRIANLKILEQQDSIIEEERLKGLLEQCGSTAHELNQPLTVLLGGICLMKLDQDDPEKISRHLAIIDDSGRRISATVKKFQSIRYDKNRRCLGSASVIQMDQKERLNNIETPKNEFKNLNDLFRIVQSRCNGTAA